MYVGVARAITKWLGLPLAILFALWEGDWMQGKYSLEIQFDGHESRMYYYVTDFAFDFFEGTIKCDDGTVKSTHTFRSKDMINVKIKV